MNPITGADKRRSYSGDYMEAGRYAEDVVMPWLMTRPWVLGVDDLRNFRPTQEADVDVSIRLTDGRVTLAAGHGWLYRTSGMRPLEVGETVTELIQ